ncbi:MAG: cupin domain-containing protein [Bacteroidales bacterium]|nr:cupin domain-containing protein [Bacteroidales bacterium]
MAIYKYKDMSVANPGNNIERRLAHLNDLMTAIIDFSNGPMIQPDPPHSHPHEQISYVAEGELYVFIGEEKYHLKEGDVFAVPSGVPHTVQTLTGNVRLIDSFSPIREDFI